MQNKTLKIDRAFFLLLVLIFLAGLLRTVFRPKEINEYENRYANQLAPLTAASYADGSFQDGMESALSDQVQFSQLAKKTYNFVTSYAAVPLIAPLENLTHGYVSAGDVSFYESKIVYQPWTYLQPEWLEAKAENLNAVIAAHPELEFYAYYIEKDTDIDFTTGQKIDASESMLSMLNLPDSHKGIYEINSFEEFNERFYNTDHHWNYIGSYEAYRDVLSVLGGGEPLEPTGVYHSGLRFSGAKSKQFSRFFSDEMTIYSFDFPPMEIQVDRVESDYGMQDELLRGELGWTAYGGVYGGDNGEVIFDTGKDGDNILIFGNSYDNAILKLLASHFSKTYSIDLRNYEHTFGEKFDFDSYVREHDISKVLFIGDISFYTMSEFMI